MALLALFPVAGCKFDTAELDKRSCSSNEECPGGQRCQDGYCQNIPTVEDVEEEADTGDVVEDVEVCTNFDNDDFRAGEDCTDEPPLDCNDFDDDVYPGAPEVCDGQDNDCDGQVDDDDPDYVEVPCSLVDGVCAGTNKACVDGRLLECTAEVYEAAAAALDPPTIYVFDENDCEGADPDGICCDAYDNDCDGFTDEDISRECFSVECDESDTCPEHFTCNTDTGLCEPDNRPCRLGTETCDPETGAFGACEGEVAPESEDTLTTRCDDVDNDCDADIDELCQCQQGEVRSCYTLGVDCPTETCPTGFTCNEDRGRCEPEHLPCRLGARECGADGFFEDECQGEVLPGIDGLTDEDLETCANPGVDNDCDGDNTLDDIEDWGEACSVPGANGVCVPGTYQCVGDSLVCVSDTLPEPETCLNPGANDDCNLVVDDIPGEGEECFVEEYWDAAESKFQTVYGVCRFGTWQCISCSTDNDCANCDNEAGCDCVDGTCADLVCVRGTGDADETSAETICDGLNNDCDWTDTEPPLSLIDEDVERSDNPQHCGACGRACGGGDSCCDGECVDLDRNAVWPEDLTECGNCSTDCSAPSEAFVQPACCGGSCTDLDDDELNCGGCNGDGGTVCSGANDTCCDGGCVNTDTDDLHCGGCDSPCRAGVEHCCGGACVPLDAVDNCGTSCSDCTTTDNQDCCDVGGGTLACQSLAVSDFCGGCGIVCEGDATTIVDSSLPCCTTAADVSSCTDRDLDMENCGVCNNDCGDEPDCGPSGDKPCDTCCPPEGGSDPHATIGHCASLEFDFFDCGGCGESCDTDLDETACCGGACTDTRRDFDNCGGCGDSCASADCDTGDCDACCPAIGAPDTGECADLEFDEDHCGACDVQCAVGDQCCNGFCVPFDDLAHCGGCNSPCTLSEGRRCCYTGTLGDSCTTDDGCSVDEVCWEGSCALPADFSCPVTTDGTCSSAIE